MYLLCYVESAGRRIIYLVHQGLWCTLCTQSWYTLPLNNYDEKTCTYSICLTRRESRKIKYCSRKKWYALDVMCLHFNGRYNCEIPSQSLLNWIQGDQYKVYRDQLRHTCIRVVYIFLVGRGSGRMAGYAHFYLSPQNSLEWTYPPCKFKSSKNGWHPKWGYCKDLENLLPSSDLHIPTVGCWGEGDQNDSPHPSKGLPSTPCSSSFETSSTYAYCAWKAPWWSPRSPLGWAWCWSRVITSG